MVPWSRSIAVSTSGFHPDNAGSTPAEITIAPEELFLRSSFFESTPAEITIFCA